MQPFAGEKIMGEMKIIFSEELFKAGKMIKLENI